MTTINSTVRPDVVLADEDHAHWVEIHPEVLEAAPVWAQRMTLDFESDGAVMVGYDAYFGLVVIGTSSRWHGGVVTPCDDGFTDVYLPTENICATEDFLRDLSGRFADAASALGKQNKAA